MSRFFAAIYDPFMRGGEEACLKAWRAELLAPIEGDVLEIGAGTGANLPHYPPVTGRLVLAEPDPHMMRRLRERLPSSPRRSGVLEVIEASGDRLPFADEAFDVVVSTLVLCSVDDLHRTLTEVRRVLRPRGKLIFLEHVAADERPSRLAWQRRLEPLWRRIAGNCHLTRRTGQAIRDAGFVVESETRESVRKAMPIVRTSIRGIARKCPA
jgi:ubiquinone/menaquinone biosynthesis C-methylase UbiE